VCCEFVAQNTKRIDIVTRTGTHLLANATSDSCRTLTCEKNANVGVQAQAVWRCIFGSSSRQVFAEAFARVDGIGKFFARAALM